MPTVTPGILMFAIRATELTKEALHGRARLVGIVLVARVGSLALRCDFDRDHRRLHPLHHIGKARGLDGARYSITRLGVSWAAKDLKAIGRRAEAVHREPGHNRCHQYHFSRREE